MVEVAKSKQHSHATWKDSELQVQLDEYGLELEGNFNRKEAIGLIKEYEAKNGVGNTVVIDGDGKAKGIEEEIPVLQCMKVIFHHTSESDLPYVFVGHNGKCYLIPREQEVDVPKYILDSCIKDAIEERMYPVTQANGDIQWMSRKVQRFPYSIVDANVEVQMRA